MFGIAVCLLAARGIRPDVVVDRDNVAIDRSCRVVIPAGMVIPDSDGDGVIHVAADGVTIDFADDARLIGAPPRTSGDLLSGVGIRIDGHRNVTIRQARVSGFKCALHAAGADGLTLENIRIDSAFTQRLRSTPQSWDDRDLLEPARNDRREWLDRHGAAVFIERSREVTVKGLVARNAQNGLLLDRVEHSRVFDCDCSFLSGWGLAMWRSEHNLVSRNAFDFCIRGYSHGVYGAGDGAAWGAGGAGILCIEQCSHNQFIENSATHGGAGLVALAGPEAVGRDDAGRGCNNNVLFGNDFSDAASFGVAIACSLDNAVVANKLTGSAIAGFRGSNLQQTVITDNAITDNGGTGAESAVAAGATEGMEVGGAGGAGGAGGICIDNGYRCVIADNRLARNRVAISLWADDADPDLLNSPPGRADHKGSAENLIARNTFEDETTALRVRRTRGTRLELNTFKDAPEKPDADEASDVIVVTSAEQATTLPEPAAIAAPVGDGKPVGARAELAGREHIVIGEWGPWDHHTPMLRAAMATSDRRIYEILGDAGAVTLDVLEGQGDLETILGEVEPGQPRTLTLRARVGIPVLVYAVRVRAGREGEIDRILRGTLIHSPWTATIFGFTADPRTDLEQWRAESRGAGGGAVTFPCDDLGWMRLGGRAPRDLPFLREAAAKLPGPERFGVIARTRFTLPAGKWDVSTLSDDGVRVTMGPAEQAGAGGGRTVLENWTRHAPTRDAGTYAQSETGPIEITVEYFQCDGDATLEFAIEKRPD